MLSPLATDEAMPDVGEESDVEDFTATFPAHVTNEDLDNAKSVGDALGISLGVQPWKVIMGKHKPGFEDQSILRHISAITNGASL